MKKASDGKIGIIGIDIGKRGAIVVRELKSSRYKAYKMPLNDKGDVDYGKLVNILVDQRRKYGETYACFERLQPIYGSSKTTAFSMGHQAGAIEAACISLGIDFLKVSPKVWQKDMFGDEDEGDTKATALVVAKKLFPKGNLIFPKGKKEHDGLVDALLLSEYLKKISQK